MTRENVVTVFLVDDHAMFRAGIRSTLSEAGCFTLEFIGEASSGAEFFAALASGINPKLVILDIHLTDTSGVEIARRLRSEHPDMKIIILSSEISKELIDELIDIGVDGYLSKFAKQEDIEAAVCSVMNGIPFYGRHVMKLMYEICVTQKHREAEKDKKPKFLFKKKTNSVTKLTERENEVMRFLCDGLQLKEIAQKLNISPRTVETHKNNILNKLGFSRVTDLIKYAFNEGMI